jgi:limonene-1,2-epoxide hydrolase
MHAASPFALLAVAAVLAGCGGGADAPRDQAREDRPPAGEEVPEGEPAPPSSAEPPAAPAPPRLPDGVPTSPDGPAPAGSERVIRTWLAAVRRADFEAAADTFARGAKVQNGGPVARLRTRAEAVLWNSALPCGAMLTSARGARGYAVVQFRLTDRRGAPCGSGRGAPAYGAIRVRDGRIVEWYRLPDPVAPSGSPEAPFV